MSQDLGVEARIASPQSEMEEIPLNNNNQEKEKRFGEDKKKKMVSMSRVRKQIHRRALNTANHSDFETEEICNYCLPVCVCIGSTIAYIIGVFFIIPNIIDSWLWRIFHMLLGTVEITFLLTSLIKTARTSPGIVDADWDLNLLDSEKAELLDLELTVKDLERRDCHVCNSYKPPRAHHSRTLGKCVYRMDHYCVWVANVVGLYNQKFFILFLFYALMAITHYFGVGIFAVFRFIIDFKEGIQHAFVMLLLLLVSTFLGPLGFVLLMFFSWTCYLLFTNQTSIEHARNRKIGGILGRYFRKNQDKFTKPPVHKHIYNTTFYNNVSCVMGKNILDWLNPFVKTDQDPINFKHIPTNEIEKGIELLREAQGKRYSRV